MPLEDDQEVMELAQTLAQDMDPTLLAEVHLGEDASDFLKSDLGRYIVGRANQDIIDDVRALKKTAPWRTRKIRDLQNRIAVRESVKGYLLEAIHSGRMALDSLENSQTRKD